MPVTLVCQYAPCSKSFCVHSRKKDTAHYCSQTCSNASKRKPVDPVICVYCGQSFVVQANRIDTARFCSTSCHNNWRSDMHLAQFWEKIQICEHGIDCIYCCFPWHSAHPNQYGIAHLHDRNIGAHCLAWELWNKKRIPKGLLACHYCHFKPCCNPSHIHIGTQKENLADSVRDNRMISGINHHNSKLTEETAAEALRFKELDWTNQSIADHLHVSNSTIQLLMSGGTWKHLPRPAIMRRQKPGPKPKQPRLF